MVLIVVCNLAALRFSYLYGHSVYCSILTLSAGPSISPLLPSPPMSSRSVYKWISFPPVHAAAGGGTPQRPHSMLDGHGCVRRLTTLHHTRTWLWWCSLTARNTATLELSLWSAVLVPFVVGRLRKHQIHVQTIP